MGLAFNVGVVNEDLLQSIYKEILDQAQLHSLQEVSTFIYHPRIVYTNFFSPLPFPLLFHVVCCTFEISNASCTD